MDGAVNATDKITNPDATDSNNGWTWTGNKNNPRNTESWTDSQGKKDYMYFDGGNWGAKGWTTTMEQKLTLPAGEYLLTAKGRSSDQVTLTMSVGAESVALPNVNASGNVFDRGWGDGSVEFLTMGEATITVKATTNGQYQWFSIGDFRLVKLRDEGIVRHVGITDLQPENLQWVIDHSPEGTVESILCFCHYSLNDDMLTDYLDYFEERGIGVINASPFSMGLLSSRGAPDWHPAPESLRDACKRAAEYCAAQGYPIEELAIQFAVSLSPRIATTLFSSASPANVLRSISYVEKPIDWQLVEKVKEIIGDQQRVRWKNS